MNVIKNNSSQNQGSIKNFLASLQNSILDARWFNAITLREHYNQEFSIAYNNKVEAMLEQLESAKKYTHIISASHPLVDKEISGRILIVGDKATIENSKIWGGNKSPVVEVRVRPGKARKQDYKPDTPTKRSDT